MKQLLFSSMIILFAISCNKNETHQSSDLIGCWNHDYETENLNRSSYFMSKCESKDFPVSNWRYSIILEKDNQGSELQLAPNDAHFYQKITWTISENLLTIDKDWGVDEYIVEIVNDESIRLTKQ